MAKDTFKITDLNIARLKECDMYDVYIESLRNQKELIHTRRSQRLAVYNEDITNWRNLINLIQWDKTSTGSDVWVKIYRKYD